jgi:hypothetical protein
MGTYTFNHPELLERDEKDIFFKNFGMIDLMYPMLFKVRPSTKAYEDGMRVAGLGTFHTKAEGTPVGFDDPVSAAKVRTVHTTYALGFRVTMEMAEDEQEDIISQMPADLGDSARDHQERLAWSLVNDAFAGDTYTGLIDGAAAVSLCNSTHTALKTGTTQSNILSPAVPLSVTGLEDLMNTASITTSQEDRYINTVPNKLIYHPTLQHTAHVLLGTEYRPGGSDNDRSTVVSSQSGIVPLAKGGVPYLSSTTAWFLASDKADLTWNDRKGLTFDQAKDSDSFDLKHYAHYRASVMFRQWEGFWGSNAA